MDCGVNTIETQDETGATRGVEIIPEGCQPVSEDICKSGFMAPADNVSFPENSLQQCCKCKAGDNCPLCEDPAACTDREEQDFIASENCFGTASGSTDDDDDEEEEEEEEEEEAEDESSGEINIYYIIGAMSFTLIVVFMMISLSRQR